MRKFWIAICTIVLGGTLTFAQATSNSGGGQTSNPGTGQPGTGNVPGTGTGQGSGADFPATAQSKTKSHNKSTHKHHKKGAKTSRDPTPAARPQNDLTVKTPRRVLQPTNTRHDRPTKP